MIYSLVIPYVKRFLETLIFWGHNLRLVHTLESKELALSFDYTLLCILNRFSFHLYGSIEMKESKVFVTCMDYYSLPMV